jgi:hypothetical protein
MVDGGSSLQNIARVKEAIMLHGGVMTSMVIWSNFRQYPKLSPTGIYTTARRPATEPPGAAELHAIFCYGWADTIVLNGSSNSSSGGVLGGYLLCKNSWGTGWGVSGNFKIAYGAAYMLQPDYTFAMEFSKFARAQEAADLLNDNVERVLDPAYPGCWLFKPPRPMRLLHVAEYLWRMSKPTANISSIDGDQTKATWRTAPQGQPVLTKMDILEDVILSNLLYNGQGKADMIQGAADPAAPYLLNTLVGVEGSAGDSRQPLSFLICNKTAGEDVSVHCQPTDCSAIR